MKRLILSLTVISLILLSCVETEPVSPIPEIGFKSYDLFQGIDSLGNKVLVGKLEFSFIDGDADFGINTAFDSSADTPDEYNYNVFLTSFEKIDSTYFPIEDDSNTPPLNYRILRDTPLDRVGQNKTVKGFIRIDMFFNLLPEYDTVRFDFYIIDRAGHKSNVESTSDIGFKGLELD